MGWGTGGGAWKKPGSGSKRGSGGGRGGSAGAVNLAGQPVDASASEVDANNKTYYRAHGIRTDMEMKDDDSLNGHPGYDGNACQRHPEGCWVPMGQAGGSLGGAQSGSSK